MQHVETKMSRDRLTAIKAALCVCLVCYSIMFVCLMQKGLIGESTKAEITHKNP